MLAAGADDGTAAPAAVRVLPAAVVELEGFEWTGDGGCDCVLTSDWGDGEWGRTVFAQMTVGNVIGTYIVSD